MYTLLILSTLSVATFALNPRLALIHRREPEPFLWSCCDRRVKPPYDSSFSETSSLLPQARAAPLESEILLPEAEETHSYPTPVVEPIYLTSGAMAIISSAIVNKEETAVLLVKDRGTEGAWTLPQTQWDVKERRMHDAVIREARRTAGITVEPGQPRLIAATTGGWVGTFSYKTVVTTEDRILNQWPGSERWTRKWATLEQAREDLAEKHPDQFDTVLLLKLKSSET